MIAWANALLFNGIILSLPLFPNTLISFLWLSKSLVFKFINSEILIPVPYKSSNIRRSLFPLKSFLKVMLSNKYLISFSLMKWGRGWFVLRAWILLVGFIMVIFLWIKNLKKDFKLAIFLLIVLLDKFLRDNSITQDLIALLSTSFRLSILA